MAAVRSRIPGRRRSNGRLLTTSLYPLSPRERDVILCRAKAKPYKILASELGISVQTAKAYAGRAFRKLGVGSSLEAVTMLLG